MAKLRENFDGMVGKNQLLPVSPLKKKDLMNDFGTNVIGGGSLREQECETDEEEGEMKLKNNGIDSQ